MIGHATCTGALTKAGLHFGEADFYTDTVELFHLVLETRLTAAEKADLLVFLQTL